MMLPPLPSPKSYQQLSDVSTLNDGVCSRRNGDLYQNLVPFLAIGSSPSLDKKSAKGIDFISFNIVLYVLWIFLVRVQLTYIHPGLNQTGISSRNQGYRNMHR